MSNFYQILLSKNCTAKFTAVFSACYDVDLNELATSTTNGFNSSWQFFKYDKALPKYKIHSKFKILAGFFEKKATKKSEFSFF